MRVVMIGFGVVGQSFADIILEDSRKLENEFGLRPRIVGIVDHEGSLEDPEGIDIKRALDSKRTSKRLSEARSGEYYKGKTGVEAIRDLECEVVIESTPTEIKRGEPGLSHIRAALKQERHVICTNKGPLALAMPALLELANHNGVKLKFSGTVGGGTPVLDFAKKCLEGSRIKSISGILNGTTNYILSRMTAEGIAMEEALSQAQKLGYAETDPTNDVGGFDTACKLVITSNYVMGTGMSLRDVDISGITRITQADIKRAKDGGNVIKLIGRVETKARVSTEEIPATHPLNVSGTFNAICFDTYPAGEITLVGKGAGGKETASSVLRDLIEIRRAFAR